MLIVSAPGGREGAVEPGLLAGQVLDDLAPSLSETRVWGSEVFGEDGARTSTPISPYQRQASTVSCFETAEGTGDREVGEAGFHFYRARFYQPSIGRFSQEDPLRLGGGQPSLFSYVGANPVLFVDPLGLKKSENLCDMPCDQLLIEILRACDKLQRFSRNERNPGRGIPFDGVGGKWGTVKGHQQGYQEWQGRLKRLWKAFEDNGCGNKVPVTDGVRSRVAHWASEPYPVPGGEPESEFTLPEIPPPTPEQVRAGATITAAGLASWALYLWILGLPLGI